MHYEIGFFLEAQAEEFVSKKAELRTSVDKDCVKQYFSSIKSSISGNTQTSFLGYAPVLEAISKHIQYTKNRQALLNELFATNNSIDIIINILNDLVEREKDKVIDAIKARCQKKYPEFLEWDCVYSREEQLIRLCV